MALPRPASRAVGAGAIVAAVAALALTGGTGATASTSRSASAQTGSAARGLDVLPFPGTPDAAPGTNIDFPAISPAQIASVRVVGSRSGVHAGHLSAQPDHAGTAFSPSRRFADGERVSVTATLRSAAAGTASGAPNARSLKFSFSVERPARLTRAEMAAPDADAGPSASDGSTQAPPSATHSFVTQPKWRVPWIQTNGKDTDTTQGRIFLSSQNTGQNSVYMLNARGDVLWYKPMSTTSHGDAAFNTRVQKYKGHRVITYFAGGFAQPPGGGKGKGYILNSSYKLIHTVTAGDGFQKQGIDLHEFTLTPQGNAFVEVWTPVHANLTSVGGPANGEAYDWIIQEVNVATNKVIWEWHALGHVPIADTYNHYIPGQPLEYFHMNSIEQLPDGHLLISARNTWAVYSIDMKTGKIAWELNGKHSSFKMGAGTHFYWQHDATLWGHGVFTVFDDGASPKEETQSRGLMIHLGNHQATLIHAYTHSPPVLASSEGSVQILGNHNVFVGWGSAPDFSEYTSSGRQIFSDGWSKPIESYRAYREDWTGTPTWSPGIAVRRTGKTNEYTVYMSWNGATQLAHWQIVGANSSSGPFKPIKRVLWASFETHTTISTGDSYFKVEAEGAHYKVLHHGISGVARPGS